jgi:hypothetical protein
MEPHATRIVVWDVPPAVECGAPFRVKVGVKCAAECGVAPRGVEVRDEHGAVVATGAVGDVPAAGTAALYYADVELTGPDAEGLHALEARVAELVDVASGAVTHTAASAPFRVRAVRAPEHVLKVVAVDARSKLPIPGARVVVHPYRTLTNADGVAELRLPKGAYRLFVTGRDRFPFRSDGEIAGDVTIRAELDEDLGPSDAELWS